VTDSRSLTRSRPAVVILPAEIDILNSHRVGHELMAAFAPGVTAVIADMTSTTICASAGIGALLMANKYAAANNAELALAVRHPSVLRILSLVGVDSLLPVYPSVAEALASGSVPDTGATTGEPGLTR
jgi:anti-sigma B factor antagonist